VMVHVQVMGRCMAEHMDVRKTIGRWWR